MNINPYLKQLNRHYQTGRATEHTHRSALEALLNTTFPDITHYQKIIIP